MTTATLEPVKHSKFSTIVNPTIVLNDVDWKSYEMMGEALRDRPNLQMTYDQGTLEIMTLSYQHELVKKRLARLIDILSEELDIPIAAGGSTTYKREAMERGLEPDECYYVENVGRVRGLLTIDLDRDPPPDFVIEVDVSNRSVKRLPIYAQLGVPEIWRWDNWTLHVHTLGEDGQYTEADVSSLFMPSFDVSELLPFVKIGLDENNLAMAKAFRAWLKQFIADRGLTS